MNRIDRLHLEFPFAGARMLRDMLRQESFKVGRKHVSTLMKRMGIEALYRKPRTTHRHPEHKVYPYLLRNLEVTRTNQVWAMDLTYIPMARGFVYMAAAVDWYSRRVLAWKLSTTMDVHLCLEAVEEAMANYDTPEIMNTDQGSQFTSQAFTGLLKDNGIRISMDGKGPGGTMCLWNGFGDHSSTKTFIFMPTTRSQRPEPGWIAISGSTTADDLTAVLTGKHRFSFTLNRCHKPWQPNPWAAIHLKNRG